MESVKKTGRVISIYNCLVSGAYLSSVQSLRDLLPATAVQVIGFSMTVCGTVATLWSSLRKIKQTLQEAGQLDIKLDHENTNLMTLETLIYRLDKRGNESHGAKRALERTAWDVERLKAIVKILFRDQMNAISKVCEQVRPLRNHLEFISVNLDGIFSIHQHLEYEPGETRHRMKTEGHVLHSEIARMVALYHKFISGQILGNQKPLDTIGKAQEATELTTQLKQVPSFLNYTARNRFSGPRSHKSIVWGDT